MSNRPADPGTLPVDAGSGASGGGQQGADGAPDVDPVGHPSLRDSKAWLGLAVGAIVLAGVLAVVVVAGRTPPLSRLLPDPLFVQRCLVLHVNLALVVWLLAFLGALYGLLPAGAESAPMRDLGVRMAALGVGWFVLSAGYTATAPVLNSYLPTIDNPLATAGLLVFAIGLVAFLVDGRLVPTPLEAQPENSVSFLPAAARLGLRTAAVAVLMALVTLGIAWLRLPSGLAWGVWYAGLVWGPGHMLQVANAAGMFTAWIMLLHKGRGYSPLSTRTAGVLFGWLAAPLMAGPILVGLDPMSPATHTAFTRLMQFGLGPVTVAFLVACTAGAVGHRHDPEGRADATVDRHDSEGQADATVDRHDSEGRADATVYHTGESEDAAGASDAVTTAAAAGEKKSTGARVAYSVSAVLTAAGIVLGAHIRDSSLGTTLVPAHLHAVIGGVTAAYMGVAVLLLEHYGWVVPSRRRSRWAVVQPLVFGAGQLCFAAGFAVSGAYGLSRHLYCYEAVTPWGAPSAGVGMVAAGGAVALAGGILFLGLVAPALTRHAWESVKRLPAEYRRALEAWPKTPDT